MENASNVQLHKIIKNSLASYLSYKWSKNKLYLKKRKNKSQKEKKNKEKGSAKLEKKHSLINLENDIFIYDAKTKTFTQLDLCDCFRNGLKYRKIDPFNTQSSKKKYELSQIAKSSMEDSQDSHNFQLTDIGDSVEQIFSNNVLKKEHWEKAIGSICPSKFDLFIRKELKKCNGKNFKAKSFRMNSKQDFESQSKNNVRSSAAIGYYKITTYDDALQCDNNQTTALGKTKRCNFIGTQKDSMDRKKMYSKGLQCKRSNNNRRSLYEEEKVVSMNETGVQCFIIPQRIVEGKLRMDPLDPNIVEILRHHKKSLPPRQKSHKRKKPLKRRSSSLSDLFPPAEYRNVGNMVQINSSAEIRKILNEKRSSPSFTLSNTGEYFRTFLGPHPRTLLTYYQTSSSSKDNGGDTNDDRYFKRQHIVVATTSNPISPICSGPCGTRRRKAPCTCHCGPNAKAGSQRRLNDDIRFADEDQGQELPTKSMSSRKQHSGDLDNIYSGRQNSQIRSASSQKQQSGDLDNIYSGRQNSQIRSASSQKQQSGDLDNIYSERQNSQIRSASSQKQQSGDLDNIYSERQNSQIRSASSQKQQSGDLDNIYSERQNSQIRSAGSQKQQSGDLDNIYSDKQNSQIRSLSSQKEQSRDLTIHSEKYNSQIRSVSSQKQVSCDLNNIYSEESQISKKGESQTDNVERNGMRIQSDIKEGALYSRSIIKSTSETRGECVQTCTDPCAKAVSSICSCCHQPILNVEVKEKKPCCECPEEIIPIQPKGPKCICDILTCLKERIKIQTEEQNRNLDLILEELNKQDRELREIRQSVERHNNSKRKIKKYGNLRECSCYAVTVQHNFTTDMTPLPDSIQKAEKEHEENSLHIQDTKSSEPEIIELFGSNEKFSRKNEKSDLKKESWKTLWNKNSEVKAFFVTDFLKKRSVKKKFASSSNTTTEDSESKKLKKEHKHWFSHLFTSKKDLIKNGS